MWASGGIQAERKMRVHATLGNSHEKRVQFL